MFIDASAICAILLHEDGWRELFDRLNAGSGKITSAMSVWESTVVVASRRGIWPSAARTIVMSLLKETDIDLISISPETAALAVEAFERFGKGRHPAALNFGDCFAYACARHFGVPLLYKGEDFARTDIEPA